MHAYAKAAIWMSGAIVSFMAMAVAGRAVSVELDTFEIMAYRSVFGALIMVVVISYYGRWADITVQNLRLHASRNLFHFMGQNLWFYALTLLPLAQLFALEFTTPIWVILLAPLLLGNPLRLAGLAAALIAFIGILIVARPGAVPLGTGTFAALGCAIGFALTYIYSKKLLLHESIFALLLHMLLMQTVLSLIFAGFDGDIALPSAAMFIPLTVITITGLVAHLCISMALTLAPASVCAPVDFVRLPAIAVVGALFYAEPMDLMVLLGAIFIFGGNYLNIISEMKNKGT